MCLQCWPTLKEVIVWSKLVVIIIMKRTKVNQVTVNQQEDVRDESAA